MATNPDTVTQPAPEAPAADIAQQLYGEQPAANDVESVVGGEQQPSEEQAPVDLDPDPNAELTEGEQQPDPIEPPISWAKDYKEQFSALPREMQEIISTREAERERYVATKANEAARTRQTVEAEARGQFEQVLRSHAEQLQRYMPAEPQRPDPRLLQGGEEHRALYYQQQAEYDYATAQRSDAQRQAQEAQAQADQMQAYQLQQEITEQNRILAEALPEWSEPSARSKLLSDLGSIGGELGYTQEQMSEARASDIMALRTAHGWKAKADKYDALMKAKMQPVRAARQASPARIAVPGTATGQAQPPRSLAATLYPNDVRR
jgi:hypothetical protein